MARILWDYRSKRTAHIHVATANSKTSERVYNIDPFTGIKVHNSKSSKLNNTWNKHLLGWSLLPVCTVVNQSKWN